MMEAMVLVLHGKRLVIRKTSITTDSKNNIITKEVSGVCALTPTTDGDDYKTVISFPGSYINNKTGDVVFKVPTGKEKILFL